VRAYSQWISYSGFVPGESNMTVYTWANGVLSDYWMSYELPEPGLGPMSFLLTGSEAMLRLDMYGKVQVSRPDGSWELAFEQAQFDPLNAVDPKRLRAYAAQLEDLVSAIQGKRDPFGQRPRGPAHDADARRRRPVGETEPGRRAAVLKAQPRLGCKRADVPRG